MIQPEGGRMTTTEETLAVSFRAGFAGDVFVPGEHGYAEARTVWNGTEPDPGRRGAACRACGRAQRGRPVVVRGWCRRRSDCLAGSSSGPGTSPRDR